MIERYLEIIIGTGVILAALFFLFFSLSAREEQPYATLYPLEAYYNNIGKLKSGDNIKIAGVPVGHVGTISLDSENYNARVLLLISTSIQIPTDSTAQVMTGEIFGNSEIRILLGNSNQTLKPNNEIAKTIDALNIEDVIGELLYNAANTSP